MMTLQRSLDIITAESVAALKELDGRRDKLTYEPKTDSLYVWCLTVTRHRPDYTYTDLYLTEILAEEAACVRILQFYGDGVWSKDYPEVLLRRMKAREFKEARLDWQHSSMTFRIERQEIQGSAQLHEIVRVDASTRRGL